ncbi:uncharacterized protein M421DRAFT_236146 [Didymella exigua CBS 183.55]|uniref:Uncharacterized protein n=1 Tax=Didymella exigua CBS 183.55 TaxID=1150837 RepID=A0A6A5REG3_9PLEO|nr:uncharacterized protein M421DRAFT_236146 [Didymella exigua CBS 183.55]KAF1925700.1 hypothetical protein M421DRAFT_236146 [Didymella exigua CBS 183.55]
MASIPSANHFHDPRSSRPHSRRNSTRRSFASSLSRSSSYLDSPRTPCPKDGDAFAYNPSHLDYWYCPQSTWDRLPSSVQKSLAAVQHAGASALTGFERLREHSGSNDGSRTDQRALEDEVLVDLDDLRPQKFRTASNASSVFLSDISSPTYSGTPASDSGSASPVPSTFSLSQSATTPASISLGPPELEAKRPSTRERSFSTPLDPQDAKYASELSYLRTEAVPRLRHAGHKVDTEWYEAKRTGFVAAEDVQAFEGWWTATKCSILKLSEKSKRMAEANGVTSNGMGWTAP